MTLTTPNQAILLVEDCEEDYFLTKRSLTKSGIKNPLIRVENGDVALNFLHKRAGFEEAPTPGIVLLDLNMPGTDGWEVLAEVKKDEKLRKIPVVVLTTSSASQDVERCYAAGANSYIVKPVEFESFMTAVQRLRDYWLELVVLPKIQ